MRIKLLKRFAVIIFLVLSVGVSYADESTTIVAINGTVEIDRGAGWRRAGVGDRLVEGDKIRTGDNSSAEMKCGNGGPIKLTENSVLKIEGLTAEERSLSIEELLIRIKKTLLSTGRPGPGGRGMTSGQVCVVGIRG